MLVYHIDDWGMGIPLAHRMKVFHLFYRIDPHRPGAGVGIGLAIVKKLIDLHHGIIQILDPPHDGCRFELQIPLSRSSSRSQP